MQSDSADDPSDSEWEREVAAHKSEALRKCQFVRATFSRSSMLVAIEPTDSGFVPWFPYKGQDYDPSRWRLVPGGWDHEHCFLCMKHILDGGTYWTNTGRDQIDLCEECYSRYCAERSTSSGDSQ